MGELGPRPTHGTDVELHIPRLMRWAEDAEVEIAALRAKLEVAERKTNDARQDHERACETIRRNREKTQAEIAALRAKLAAAERVVEVARKRKAADSIAEMEEAEYEMFIALANLDMEEEL